MKDSVYQKLKESSWQRKLSPQEEAELDAYMVAHPEARADWEAETGLNQLLDKLPDAPLSSNFTAQVLQAVQLEETRLSRVQKRGWTAWRTGFRWVFRSAIAGFAACLGLLGLHQYQLSQQVAMARNVEATVAIAPKVEWLQDFDTIHQMSNVSSPADEELLAALK